MAKRSRRRAAKKQPVEPQDGDGLNQSSFGFDDGQPSLDAASGESNQTTGRKIVTILSNDPEDKQKVLEYFANRDVSDVMSSADFDANSFDVTSTDMDGAVLDHVPILILNSAPHVESAIHAPATTLADQDIQRLFVIEDDMRLFPSCSGFSADDFVSSESGSAESSFGGVSQPVPGPSLSSYHTGYLHGLKAVAEGLLSGALNSQSQLGTSDALSASSTCFGDTSASTWGLQPTGVASSPLTGLGIKIAILDTGFEFGHLDLNFASRVISRTSTVGGSASDHHGHGTHVAGTACGPRNPGGGVRRYGVASESEIMIARVLGASGGSNATVLAGINWAIGQGCDLINMSLGPKNVCVVNPPYSLSIQQVALAARQNGILMIAAAGNNSKRSIGRLCPVSGPAAAPSIVAVAAVDQCGRVADFSNRGIASQTGGEINFAAPGVGVFSAWKNPFRHNSIPGTSMAAPHVTGVAALIAQETGLRGLPLYSEMRRRVRNIGGDRRDIGNGFIQV